MINRLKKTTIGIITILLFASVDAKAAVFTDNQLVDCDKKWIIHLNKEIVLDDLTKQVIKVTDTKGDDIDMTLSLGQDNKSIIVTAPRDGYTSGEKFKLTIGDKVHSKDNEKLKKSIVLNFNIKSTIVDVTSLSLNKTVAKYKYKLGESYNLLNEPNVNSKIKELLGNDYDTFKNCTHSITSDIEYHDVNKTYTITGAMPGLFTIMESIIQLDENGNINLAFSYIGDSGIGIVKYYTTEKGQASSVMPENIKDWINSKFPKSIVIRNDGVNVDNISIDGYYTNTQFHSNLDIKLNDNHISFVGNADWGSHVGYVEGTAEIIDGRYAIYTDEFGTLKFTFCNDKLEVDEIGSFGGLNVTFGGTYEKN